MEQRLTANQVSGRATGALFFSGFGAAWFGLGLYAKGMLTAGWVIAVAAPLTALLLSVFGLVRLARRFPKAAEDKAVSRAFNRINLLQWVAIGIVGFAFAKLKIDAYVISAITAIVGIHLFPLAKLFHHPMHNFTGAVLVVWASVTVLFVPVDRMQSTTAIGTGIILWASAAWSMVHTYVEARQAAAQVAQTA